MGRLRHKILVVDDDPQIFRIISRLLDVSQYQVEPAPDGPSALVKIRQHRPELLILDLMMPDMSGFDLCQQIKENRETQNIKVLILSAKDTQSDRRKCFEMGADDYITKPFHIASLARKIEYLFHKKKPLSDRSTLLSHFEN